MDGRDAAATGERDPCDRDCPSCGTPMTPVGLPSGEVVARCPDRRQVAI